MNGKNQLAIFGVVISIGIIISTYLVTDVIRDVRLSHQIIKVRGYAEKNVVSDLAVWDVDVKTRTKNIIEGYLRAARQERFSIRSANSTNISSDSSSDDLYSIKKKITAVVTVDYSMK